MTIYLSTMSRQTIEQNLGASEKHIRSDNEELDERRQKNKTLMRERERERTQSKESSRRYKKVTLARLNEDQNGENHVSVNTEPKVSIKSREREECFLSLSL